MRSTAGNRTPVVISGFLLRLPVRSHSAFGQASVSSAPMAAVWTSGNVFPKRSFMGVAANRWVGPNAAVLVAPR